MDLGIALMFTANHQLNVSHTKMTNQSAVAHMGNCSQSQTRKRTHPNHIQKLSV